MELLLSVLAKDKPGLVKQLSQAVRECNGNWHASSLTHLAGQFAGIVQIDLPEDQKQCLHQKLESLKLEGLQVQLTEIEPEELSTESEQYRLQVVGNDRPGIVHEISQLLTRHGANVEALVTRHESAAWSGGYIFTADITVSLQDKKQLQAIQDALENLANDLMVDADLQPAPGTHANKEKAPA